MTAPNWREVFGRALWIADAPNTALENLHRQQAAVPGEYLVEADAILAAIRGRGYRLHRDHDMKYVPAEGAMSEHFRCVRCGHRDSDLGMPTMSCEGPA